MGSYKVKVAFIGLDTREGFSGKFYDSMRAEAMFKEQTGCGFHVYAGNYLIGASPFNLRLPDGWCATRVYSISETGSRDVTLQVYKARVR